MVELRELVSEDAARIALLANDSRIADNLRNHFPHPYSLDNATYFLNEMVAKQDPRENFGIYYKDELTGIMGIHPFDDIYSNSAEIGYWLGLEYWGKGIMTQAIPLILKHGFEVMKLHRIQAGVIGYNKGSMRVLEKCGMQLEGIHREHVFKNGAFHDEYVYAVVQE